MDTIHNTTEIFDQSQWNSKPQWLLPRWAEPLVGQTVPIHFACTDMFQIVASILFGTMFFTRKKHFKILSKQSIDNSYLAEPHSNRSSQDLLAYCDESDDDDIVTTSKYPPKQRRWCGLRIYTPNTSRFKNNIHSRFLQKFPFLIEMFYWIINYAFYRMTAITSEKLFAGRGIWNVAKSHGIAILEFEQFGWLSFLFPIQERSVQQWFMNGHQDALTILNRTYALIHIPGTVG
jgi:hypothetical protein